jgi:hypothetical protein
MRVIAKQVPSASVFVLLYASICALAPVKQKVNKSVYVSDMRVIAKQALSLLALLVRHYLFFCTREASKPSS